MQTKHMKPRTAPTLQPWLGSCCLAIFLTAGIASLAANSPPRNRRQTSPAETSRHQPLQEQTRTLETVPFRQLRRAARDGDPRAQLALGKRYFSGHDNLKIDLEEAAGWFRKSAEQGNPVAQFNYAVCLDTGQGVGRNRREALRWYLKAAEQGVQEAVVSTAATAEALGEYELALQYYEILAQRGLPNSMRKVAAFHEEGLGTEVDPERAFGYMQEAARQGDVRAQVKMADFHQRGFGTRQSVDRAVNWLWIAAGNGSPEAQGKIGLLFMHGTGVSRDPATAVAWLEQSARTGYAPAQVAMGNAYLDGAGVQINEQEALRWFRLASGQNHPAGHFSLGVAYAMGHGVEKDETMAKQYFRRAAEQGHPPAQYNLGFFYEHGIGLEQPDPQEAVQWYQKAADENDANAIHALAICMIEGKGMEENQEKGRELLHRAARLGSNHAIRDLRERFDIRF